ncbi:McrC McrBC 5-methylcytosine restriction system component [Oxalobacteraceae bacterium]
MGVNQITCYEFHKLVSKDSGLEQADDLKVVTPQVFEWLEGVARGDPTPGTPAWIRPSRRRGSPAVELTSYVGVVRAPDGTQIEILPKIGKSTAAGAEDARPILLAMLSSLPAFKHLQTSNAELQARKMPLLDVFIHEFLIATQQIVKRGLRGGYSSRQDNIFSLRGKLQFSTHLRENLCRRDRFFAEFDEFSSDRAENRLLHSALRCALSWASLPSNQHLARELSFVFSDIPVSKVPAVDLQLVRLDRDMGYYTDALAWAKLLLQGLSPLTGFGLNEAPSLLFPMQDLYEAFVAKHLKRQLEQQFKMHKQPRSFSLVKHDTEDWFQLKPDLLVSESSKNCMVLDTKWKLLDSDKNNASEKYDLSQGDFYQMYAYGQNYLKGSGDLVLIYPKTDSFNHALKMFAFPNSEDLRLWVLPFCLRDRRLVLPTCGTLDGKFKSNTSPASTQTVVGT